MLAHMYIPSPSQRALLENMEVARHYVTLLGTMCAQKSSALIINHVPVNNCNVEVQIIIIVCGVWSWHHRHASLEKYAY